MFLSIKDMNFFSPFVSSNNPKEKLPALEVAKHKQLNCIRKIVADESVLKEIGYMSAHGLSSNIYAIKLVELLFTNASPISCHVISLATILVMQLSHHGPLMFGNLKGRKFILVVTI